MLKEFHYVMKFCIQQPCLNRKYKLILCVIFDHYSLHYKRALTTDLHDSWSATICEIKSEGSVLKY